MIVRQKEVVDVMEMLFSQEKVWELDRREIADEARQEGEMKGLFRAIRSLIETTGMSAEQAMAALQITGTDRPQYLNMLGSVGQ